MSITATMTSLPVASGRLVSAPVAITAFQRPVIPSIAGSCARALTSGTAVSRLGAGAIPLTIRSTAGSASIRAMSRKRITPIACPGKT
ncbi:MAG: hypothetical protein WDN44_07410 [Sphingomonas sp.]